MFEVKYPISHGLDGKIHKIEISSAFEIQVNGVNRIIIYGKENGRKVILEVVYSHEIKKWIKVPHSSMEYLNITLPFRKKVDITEKIKKELDGKKITNLEEINEELVPSKKVKKTSSEIKTSLIMGSLPPRPPKVKNDFETTILPDMYVWRHPVIETYFISSTDAKILGWLDETIEDKKIDVTTYGLIDSTTLNPDGFYCLNENEIGFIKKNFNVIMNNFIISGTSTSKNSNINNNSENLTFFEYFNLFFNENTNIVDIINLFINFNKGKYNNQNIEKHIMNFANDMLNFFLNFDINTLTNEDLLSLRNLFSKLLYSRFNTITSQFQTFSSIRIQGKKIIDELQNRKGNKKMGV